MLRQFIVATAPCRRTLTTFTNYFQLLGVHQRFDIDVDVLAARFKHLQRQWHPDLHASGVAGTDPEQAARTSALLNTAYGVLRDPHERATHLLQLLGEDTDADDTPEMDPSFLAWVIDCRERIADMKANDDDSDSKVLREQLDNLYNECMGNLKMHFNDGHVEKASKEAARLKYISRMRVALDDVSG